MRHYTSFVCEWERPDCPTKGMGSTEMYTYWKRHALESDIRFYLSVCSNLPHCYRHTLETILARITERPARKADAIEVRQVMQRYHTLLNAWDRGRSVPLMPRQEYATWWAQVLNHCEHQVALEAA